VLAFGKKMAVTGFDVNAARVADLRKGIDPTGESGQDKFKGITAEFTTLPDALKLARIFIVAVPTPVDEHNVPELAALRSATQTVAKALKKGDLVIYESTVYPGCTEEECVPVLEQISGLKFKSDFKVGFSPERINPGDHVHQLENTVKVTAGCDEESSATIAALYRLIVTAGVYPVSTIKVAETAKIIENTQRDLNIALMNELSIICNKMGINTYEALEAAGTKWNFLKFSPGLVGGHCIGVDPYYLTYKAQKVGYHPHVILAGRYVNDSMGFYVAKQTVKRLLAKGLDIRQARVLVLGFTFKEDISDIRNTRVADLVRELQSYQASVTLTDPHANPAEVRSEYGLEMVEEVEEVETVEMVEEVETVEMVEEVETVEMVETVETVETSETSETVEKKFDAVVIAVAHKEYRELTEQDFEKWLKPGGLVVDVKGIFRGKMEGFDYFSL